MSAIDWVNKNYYFRLQTESYYFLIMKIYLNIASLKVLINIEKHCEKHCVRKLQCSSFWNRINTRAAHTTYNFPSGFYCKFSARDSTRASLTCKYQAADDGRGDFHSREWGMQQEYMRIACMCMWQCCARGTFPLSRNDVVCPERSDAIARMSRSRGQGRTHASSLVYLWPRDPVAPSLPRHDLGHHQRRETIGRDEITKNT